MTKEQQKSKGGAGIAVTKEQVMGERWVLAMFFSRVPCRSDCHSGRCSGNCSIGGPKQEVWKIKCWAGFPT